MPDGDAILGVTEAMLRNVATAAHYVRTARPPSREEVARVAAARSER